MREQRNEDNREYSNNTVMSDDITKTAMRLCCLYERVDTSQRERDRDIQRHTPTETYRETERESQNRRQTNADPEIWSISLNLLTFLKVYLLNECTDSHS